MVAVVNTLNQTAAASFYLEGASQWPEADFAVFKQEEDAFLRSRTWLFLDEVRSDSGSEVHIV